MKPLQMTFRHIDPMTEVELAIRAEADALYADLVDARSCEVIIDRAHKPPLPGSSCSVRVGLSVPGVYLVAETDASDSSPEALIGAVRGAFDTVHARALARRKKLNRPQRRLRQLPRFVPSAA